MQILKRHNLRKYFSCHSTFGRRIHRMYCIEPSLHNSPSFVPGGSWKFCRWSQSSSSLLSSFSGSTKLLHCSDGSGYYFSWGISSVGNRTWWYFLSSFSFPSNFLTLFRCNKLWVSFSLRHLRFLEKLFTGVCSEFLCDSMGNRYCKKDNSKGKVNLAEITQK